jgi:hypothetical protein
MPPASSAPTARRRWPIWLGLLVLPVLGFGIYSYPSLKAQAEAGSAYAARIGCSCRYVQGREMDSCVRDFEPGMEIVSVADDTESKTVTGAVPLLASRSASYRGASGCVLNPED